jgi:serine/threonine-protein kinase
MVPILEVGTSDAGYYLVMEYIEGETLARLIASSAHVGERVPAKIIVRILIDALGGLEAAHKLRDDDNQPLNIVHRDVSPQNVMVGVDGTTRITDFGVARAATRLSTTRDGQLKGKLGYMAPEQARGDDIDARTDIFSAGIMLWETLAGRRLFRAGTDSNDAAMLNRLLFEPIPRLTEIDPAIDEGLANICERALQREPDGRFATCAQFQDALEAVAQGSCGIASAREVAAYVETVAGPEIAAQKSAVRAWTTQSESSRKILADLVTMPNIPTSPSSISSRSDIRSGEQRDSSNDSSTNALVPPVPEAGRRRGVLLGMVAGMLILALPVGGVLLFRNSSETGVLPAQSVTIRSADTATPATNSGVAGSTPSASDLGDAAVPVATETASSSPAPPSSSGGRQTGVSQPVRLVPKGKPPSGRSDDLENNPYR